MFLASILFLLSCVKGEQDHEEEKEKTHGEEDKTQESRGEKERRRKRRGRRLHVSSSFLVIR